MLMVCPGYVLSSLGSGELLLLLEDELLQSQVGGTRTVRVAEAEAVPTRFSTSHT